MYYILFASYHYYQITTCDLISTYSMIYFGFPIIHPRHLAINSWLPSSNTWKSFIHHQQSESRISPCHFPGLLAHDSLKQPPGQDHDFHSTDSTPPLTTPTTNLPRSSPLTANRNKNWRCARKYENRRILTFGRQNNKSPSQWKRPR